MEKWRNPNHGLQNVQQSWFMYHDFRLLSDVYYIEQLCKRIRQQTLNAMMAISGMRDVRPTTNDEPLVSRRKCSDIANKVPGKCNPLA